jgi:alkylation response protein AidB-like acyl-CoA dehydrogenase
MDFHLSEMQQMLVDSARRFVAEQTGLEQWIQRRTTDDGLSDNLWSTMAELGWLALAVPEDAGGLGGAIEDVALLMMELGKGLVTEPFVSTGIIAAHIFDRTLPTEQREAWLERIAMGSVRVALAHTDPQSIALAPLAAQKTTAGYVLDGHKFMALDAASADHLIVQAQLDGAAALFLVEAIVPGLEATHYPLIDGSRAGDLRFANVAVPDDALLATGDAALSIMAAALDRGRVALVAQAVGAMDEAVRITADYARERKQFGQPIGKFQAIQHLATDMFVAAYQARSALYAALRNIDAEPRVRSRAVSQAKLIAGMAGQTVSRNGIQIHGGYGITDEYAISHFYRRLLVLEKQYGGNDDHAALLAAAEVTL